MRGREVVETIEAMLSVDSRNSERALAEELGAVAKVQLEALGLVNRENELFGLFRKTDMQNMRERYESPGKEVPKFQTFARLVAQTRGWSVYVDADAAESIYTRNSPLYSTLRPRLHAARNQASHVGAVLRPFSRRYLDRWDLAALNGRNFDEARARISSLENQEIDNEVALEAWARAVYEDLFYELAVIKKDRTSGDGDSDRPMGTIQVSSERTYRQQWFAWLAENTRRILQAGKQTEGETPATHLVQEPGRTTTVWSTELQTATAAQQPERASWMTAKVWDPADPSVRAERSWFTKDEALLELAGWITTLSLLWGGTGRSVLTAIEFASPSGSSKFTLPQNKLADLGEALRPVISGIS